ncbi:MAG: hypothetical protein OXF08_09580 [Bacteroidetes bacterium]|nr:hypothetical protein [Bacteroidota bacterium]
MIDFGVNAWPLLLLIVVSSLLTWFSYRNPIPQLEGFYQWLLPLLRGLSLSLLLVLLFEPALHRNSTHTSLPLQAVLIDESQSTHIDQIPTELPHINGETRFFGFGGITRPLQNLSAAKDTAPRTDIAHALEEIKHSLHDQNLRSVLLITDGQYNTGSNPIYVATDYGIPIHTLITGDTLQKPDLAIARTITNQIGFVGQEIPLDVTLHLQGYDNQTVSTSLIVEDSLISVQTLTILAGESTVSLRFIPHRAGLFQYRLFTSELENEPVTENNRLTFTVRVLERQQTICLIGAAPHPDLTVILNILSHNEKRDVLSYVQMQNGQFYEGNFIDSANECDAIILVGYPGNEADNGSIRTIANIAESGTPLLFMLTRQTDLQRLQTMFGHVLPAQPIETSVLYDEALIELTQSGLRDPILPIPSYLWDRLPPLITTTGRWTVSSDSRTLAQANLRGIPTKEPLLVIRSRGGHRSAIILGSGTWRWHNTGDDSEEISSLWPTIVDNLIQWLTTPEDDRTVRIQPDRDEFDGSEPITFSGQVYDESLNPVPDAIVTLDVTGPDGATYPYTMNNVGNGRFALQISALPEGAYSYSAQAIRMGAPTGEDSGVFTIGSINLEYLNLSSNETLLRQLSHQSGGHFFTEASLNTLPEILSADTLFTSLTQRQRLEINFLQTPWLLALVILLLGLEWILRKRNGLA